MAGSPYEQPGADVAFWVLVGLFALGEGAVRVRSRLNRSGARVERWSLAVVASTVTGGVLGGLAVAGWPATTITVGRWPVFIVGLVSMAGGICLRQWAVFTLGRFFTIDVRVHAGQAVVEAGPYRWVRHPAYSGLVVFLFGLGLALTNWMSLLVLVVVPMVGLVVRIQAEERALLAGLGEPYGRYAAAHKRLVPGLW